MEKSQRCRARAREEAEAEMSDNESEDGVLQWDAEIEARAEEEMRRTSELRCVTL